MMVSNVNYTRRFVYIEVTDSLGCINQEIFDIDFDIIGIPSFTFDSSGIVLCDAIAVNDIIEFSNTSTGIILPLLGILEMVPPLFLG